MREYSRIVIERHCLTHNSAKSKRLGRLLEQSYDSGCEYTDDDAIFLENAILREKDPELKEALEDLDSYLGCY